MMALAMAFPYAQEVHPRPDFERKDWLNLNGFWEFQFDPEEKGLNEEWWRLERPYALTIRVPYGWESRLSGIERKDYSGVAWYRREFTLPAQWRGKRLWLCFGAVDHHAQVWLNGQLLGFHEGGYSEFRLEITAHARFDRPNTLVVRAADYTDPETPLGKQIPSWYTKTSGIWQTVWIEATGEACIQSVRIVPQGDSAGIPTGEVEFTITIERGAVKEPLTVEIRSPEKKFPSLRQALLEGEEATPLRLKVPRPQFWTPDNPVLYDYELRLTDAQGRIVYDTLSGYFGIRTVRWGTYTGSDISYVLLNGKPIFLRGVLDQSFNPEGIYTAPNDALLRRDIELAKQAGFNMVRIHIKADEPRKLYWADRLGMLVQADIPCFFQPSERARQLYEKTLRDQIARDFNHPSIIIWTLFNEEWGIGRLTEENRSHRVDWVLEMVALARQLDPTRLIHDNSGWSHLESDLNSFHWYGRDVDALRLLYQAIDHDQVRRGSQWNYIDGRVSRGEPFINNEYSYLAAFDGDGDWSWGNLFATNALRSLTNLVGYTYTELTDIEWEHNGVYNYDRTPKEFGYDFWAPGMSIRDVFAEDFLVLDVPAIKRVGVGERVQVPVKFSHYSARWTRRPFLLHYRLDWIDTLGRRHRGRVVSQRFQGALPYRVNPLTTLELNLPDKPCLATLVAWLEGANGDRIHINYTQWAVGLDTLPKTEWHGRRQLIVRFAPTDFSRSEFSLQSQPDKPIVGKHYGRGHGFIEYAIPLSEEVDLERLERITLRMEVSAKAGREKVDWEQRVHPDDYPQTDGKKYPSRVLVEMVGQRVAEWNLPDDPADARGVLSHWAGVERGSYGYLQEAHLPVDATVREILQRERLLHIRLIVPPDLAGGVAIYGVQMGCFPMEPTVLFEHR